MHKDKQLELISNNNVVRCRICNRKLKSDKSKSKGYGDYCYKLYLKSFRGFQSTIDDFIVGEHD